MPGPILSTAVDATWLQYQRTMLLVQTVVCVPLSAHPTFRRFCRVPFYDCHYVAISYTSTTNKWRYNRYIPVFVLFPLSFYDFLVLLVLSPLTLLSLLSAWFCVHEGLAARVTTVDKHDIYHISDVDIDMGNAFPRPLMTISTTMKEVVQFAPFDEAQSKQKVTTRVGQGYVAPGSAVVRWNGLYTENSRIRGVPKGTSAMSGFTCTKYLGSRDLDT